MPGSVQMTVNSLPETRFQADAAYGRLTDDDRRPADRPHRGHLQQGRAGVLGGDILFTWTDRIAMSDALNLSFGAGLRWNVNPWSYSQVAYSKSGTIIATAGIDGKTDNLAYSAQGAFSFTNPDTSGILRLFGMEGNLMPLDLSEDNAYPASVPDPTESGMGPVSKLNRGFLFYRDFRVYDSFGGSSLQTFEQANPPQMPLCKRQAHGPLQCRGQQRQPRHQQPRLRVRPEQRGMGRRPASYFLGIRCRSFQRARHHAAPAQPQPDGKRNVYLQIGSISEDLDSTGILKAESPRRMRAFPWSTRQRFTRGSR